MSAPASALARTTDPPARAAMGAGSALPALRRLLLWGLLLALLAVAQTSLVVLTLSHEAWRARQDAEAAAAEAASVVRRDLLRLTHALQSLTALAPHEARASAAASAVLSQHTELRRIEWRSARFELVAEIEPTHGPAFFARLPRLELMADAEAACRGARRSAVATYSRSYFVPQADGSGQEVSDLCVPLQHEGRETGFLVATVALPALLEAAAAAAHAAHAAVAHELTFIESDGARLARAGARRGAGVHVAEQPVDLPGQALRLRADSAAGHPSLIPNLTLALVLGLSIALFGVVFALARDVRRRAKAEQALAESLGFRKAMEDSLGTGLRARDMAGAITYVNPAFCAMVGYSAEELRAVRPPTPPPYWPAERAAEYAERQRHRFTGLAGAGVLAPREGFETLFQRKNGERFPALVHEAPLLDGEGRQTGWMGSVLDLSAQRRIEDLSRQQQERLQASARLATVGEMASLLSHELNQPLSAIASYASGSLNLLDEEASAPAVPASAAGPNDRGPNGQRGEPSVAQGAAATATATASATAPLLHQALTRIAEQAERAGRIIKSVHDFVRRREQQRETIACDLLLAAVLPLVRLQARKSATQIECVLPEPPQRMPRVVCDRTMVEQVLLNLARNGIQAMENATPLPERWLVIAVSPVADGRVRFELRDAGHGIAPEVARRLFTPFFTTRAEGMGLGLSLCRTVVEQHGGVLEFGPGVGGRGATFCFTLPGARGALEAAAPPAAVPSVTPAAVPSVAPAAAPGAAPAVPMAPESGDTGAPASSAGSPGAPNMRGEPEVAAAPAAPPAQEVQRHA